jgi:TonB family protein
MNPTMLTRTWWCFVAILLLAGMCAASIPRQNPDPDRKPAAVSDADWLPPFEVEPPSGREQPRAGREEWGEWEHPAEVPSAASELPRCPSVLPPRPVTTPLPDFHKAGRRSLKVQFLIGTDGRLHKLAIVNSAGRAADSKAVNALRHWRYAPAMCNGIPMEAEGTIEFPGQ